MRNTGGPVLWFTTMFLTLSLLTTSLSHLPSSCLSSLCQHICDPPDRPPSGHKMGAKYPTHLEQFPTLFSLLLRLCWGLCATSVSTMGLAPDSASKHFPDKPLFTTSSLLLSLYNLCKYQSRLSNQLPMSIYNAFLPSAPHQTQAASTRPTLPHLTDGLASKVISISLDHLPPLPLSKVWMRVFQCVFV